MSQEFFADMLGSTRSTVSITATLLKACRAHRIQRGVIQILDKPGLEAKACECYRVIDIISITTLSSTAESLHSDHGGHDQLPGDAAGTDPVGRPVTLVEFGDFDFAAVGGGEGDVGEGPVFGVGDGAGGGGLDVEVVELEVDQRGVGVGADGEGPSWRRWP